MGSRWVVLLLALLVACHISVATIFVETESRLRCRCERTISVYFRPEKLDSIMIYPPGISCRHPEIIVTLKKWKQNPICVNPKMRWVERLMKTMQIRNETSS
ncbi:C-X-C motif chemokine 13 [Tiliqua scincoides]|uniref:C-X-C motif chemokine 13 n=1 Tax=Tiliqua scincoides TaxID=71010 RepID=UPI0034632A56